MKADRTYTLDQVEVRLKLKPAQPLYSEKPVTTPERAIEVMKGALMEMDRECCCVLNLDVKGRPINFNVVSIGDTAENRVPTQNVFKSAILSNASSVIMFHNHPSGNVEPSYADVKVTENLVNAGKIMNIPVNDHVIIGGGSGESYSFRSHMADIFEKDHSESREKTVKDDAILMEVSQTGADYFVNIQEYAKRKHTDVHIINGYISAHREAFRGHIAKGKSGAKLDGFAREKLDIYIDSRPDRGIRFSRFGRNEMQNNLEQQEKNSRDVLMERDSDIAYSDTEIGVDTPDESDGADDRDSYTVSNPSKNPRKSKSQGAKHYKVSKISNHSEEKQKEKYKELNVQHNQENVINEFELDSQDMER